MTALVFTIIEAPAYGWAAGRGVAGFAASAVLLAAFIAWERRAAHPMLDVTLTGADQMQRSAFARSLGRHRNREQGGCTV